MCYIFARPPHSRDYTLYQLALHIDKERNVPQVQFKRTVNGTTLHHLEDKGALKAGAWFPHLMLHKDGRLIDHRVGRPRARKSAGFKQVIQQAPLEEAAAEGAGSSDGPAAPKPKRRSMRWVVALTEG